MSQPRATQAVMAAAPLLDPVPGTVHVYDLAVSVTNQRSRISDHVFGMLWYANIESVITQFTVCEFRMAFFPHLILRDELRVHEGQPLLGPDGLVMIIRGQAYNGGNSALVLSQLSGTQVLTHPNYQAWISNLLFAGAGRYDSQYRHNLVAANSSTSSSKIKEEDTEDEGPVSDANRSSSYSEIKEEDKKDKDPVSAAAANRSSSSSSSSSEIKEEDNKDKVPVFAVTANSSSLPPEIKEKHTKNEGTVSAAAAKSSSLSSKIKQEDTEDEDLVSIVTAQVLIPAPIDDLSNASRP